MLENKKGESKGADRIAYITAAISIIGGILIFTLAFIKVYLLWFMIPIGIIPLLAGVAVIISKATDAKRRARLASNDIRRATIENARIAYASKAIDTEKHHPVNCPACDEDLAFMGWNDSDLKNVQICPLCGKKVQLYRMI